jgi:hypothetical protein
MQDIGLARIRRMLAGCKHFERDKLPGSGRQTRQGGRVVGFPLSGYKEPLYGQYFPCVSVGKAFRVKQVEIMLKVCKEFLGYYMISCVLFHSLSSLLFYKVENSKK